MKRTCKDCRALNGEHCSLGKKINFDLNKAIIRGYREYFPLEECNKPKTYSLLIYELNKQAGI